MSARADALRIADDRHGGLRRDRSARGQPAGSMPSEPYSALSRHSAGTIRDVVIRAPVFWLVDTNYLLVAVVASS